MRVNVITTTATTTKTTPFGLVRTLYAVSHLKCVPPEVFVAKVIVHRRESEATELFVVLIRCSLSLALLYAPTEGL